MNASPSRIDSHQHYWRPERGDYYWMDRESALFRSFSPSDLQPSLSRHGISGTVLVQAAPTTEETDFLLELAEQTSSVLGVVGWIDFEERLHSGTLERLVMHPKFKGVRPMIQDIADPKWVCHSNLDWAFDAVTELELCFDALVFPEQVPFLLKRLIRHPGLKVVIDHGAKPFIRDEVFEPWASQMTRLARETSALVKLSGLVTEARLDWSTNTLAPYVEHLLQSFGPDRMMWGSDWPVCLLATTYDRWIDTTETLLSGCSETEKSAILGGNAIRFYDLEVGLGA